MGQIMHRSTNKVVPLGPDSVAGRASGSPVLLTDPAASTHHASLVWSGERWEARDLGSTNGTSVDGQPIRPKESVPISRGARLRFGSDQEEWELIEDGPPAAAALRVFSGEVRMAENGVLALPSDDDVTVSVVRAAAGPWTVEAEDGSSRPARHGERLQIAGDTWELIIPAHSPTASTYKASGGVHLARATLRFLVSPDDKHVRLEIVEGDQVCQLGEKACFSLLLLLARKRIEDAEARIPEHEQGWVHVIDALERLRKEENALNVDVNRARTILSGAGVECAAGIVERRTREMRIGTGRLIITGS